MVVEDYMQRAVREHGEWDVVVHALTHSQGAEYRLELERRAREYHRRAGGAPGDALLWAHEEMLREWWRR